MLLIKGYIYNVRLYVELGVANISSV